MDYVIYCFDGMLSLISEPLPKTPYVVCVLIGNYGILKSDNDKIKQVSTRMIFMVDYSLITGFQQQLNKQN